MSSGFWFNCARVQDLEHALDGEWLKGKTSPRIALVGRSNVGKSTLINSLLETKTARTSSTPGKTKTIGFYIWENDPEKILVDLPGYGFARTAHEEKKHWDLLLDYYFRTDPKLERILLLWDARHAPTNSDEEALGFFQESGIPLEVVFTKMDLLKTQSERAKRKKECEAALLRLLGKNSVAHWISVKTGDGLKTLRYHLLHGT